MGSRLAICRNGGRHIGRDCYLFLAAGMDGFGWFYSQSKTIYTIKDSGVLEVKSVWGKRFCVDGIRNITYQPHALGMQKIKVEHAQGFVMISPDRPLEFVEALKKVCPGLAVEGFELIKN